MTKTYILKFKPETGDGTKRISAARVEAVGDGRAFYSDDGSLYAYFAADLLEDFAEETSN